MNHEGIKRVYPCRYGPSPLPPQSLRAGPGRVSGRGGEAWRATHWPGFLPRVLVGLRGTAPPFRPPPPLRYCTEGKRTFSSRLILEKHIQVRHGIKVTDENRSQEVLITRMGARNSQVGASEAGGPPPSLPPSLHGLPRLPRRSERRACLAVHVLRLPPARAGGLLPLSLGPHGHLGGGSGPGPHCQPGFEPASPSSLED